VALVIDPVCGQQFDSTDAVAQSQYQGKTYYFDATDCQLRFEEDPARYANHPTGDQGRVTHTMGDRHTSPAGHTRHTVVGGPNYDNERMQDRAPSRKPATKRTSLGDTPRAEARADEETPRH
jgi:YHS domain-containing protein